MVPLILQRVKEKHLALNGAVKRLCERPGEIFGIKKGRIAPGFDADIGVYDLGTESVVRADNLHSKCGWTPYEGSRAIFPKAVFLRGQLMVEGGSQVGERIGRDVVV